MPGAGARRGKLQGASARRNSIAQLKDDHSRRHKCGKHLAVSYQVGFPRIHDLLQINLIQSSDIVCHLEVISPRPRPRSISLHQVHTLLHLYQQPASNYPFALIHRIHNGIESP